MIHTEDFDVDEARAAARRARAGDAWPGTSWRAAASRRRREVASASGRPRPRRPAPASSWSLYWSWYSFQYMPRCASSSAWRPRSRMRPLCITRISSTDWMVDSRCAITIAVRSLQQHLERVLDERLGLGVDGGGGLVQDQHARVVRQRARERQQLLLSDRQRGAALGHLGVVAARQRLDEAVRVHRPGGRRARARLRDGWSRAGCWRRCVPLNRCTSCSTSASEERSSARSSSRTSMPSSVTRPAVDVVEARQQADDGGLAGAGRAHERDALARLDREADVAEHAVLVLVGERHVLERDAAAHRRAAGSAARASPRAARRVEQREDALGRTPSPPAGC